MNKNVRISAALVTLAIAATACGSSSSGGTASNASNAAASSPTKLKIMVGGISKQIYLPNELTAALGFFKEENLDVTLIDEASGQSSEQQVLSGGVQAGSGSYNHTIELQAAGKSMETVVQLQTAPGEALMVGSKVADKIKSASDLKGANMGVTELGSGTQTLSTAIL